ncbi:peptidoglycan DD-metalloendopeptidase family protein [Glaciihabitans sp. UYNi722]|uniref:M23 family metallopeptidase n=1 Tax=Glaciihabitans sp. UYNi722 TaxID=3156344 RepID=UPI003395F7D5
MATLRTQSEQTAALAESRGAEYEAADQKFQEAAFKATALGKQADTANALAASSRAKAGQTVAQLARTGGQNLSMRLFADSKDSGQLLSRLGFQTKLAQLAGGVYAKATRDRNSAQSLTDQANRAAKSREQLRAVASQALDSARIASAAADAAVVEQVQNQADLQAQLTVLTEKRAATETDFAAGEAARAAAAAAAAAARVGSAGKVSPSGWADPTSGRLVSPYGYRIHPIYKDWRLHNGDDLAGGCNVPIYAATSGRVSFSGLNGGYGNFIILDHRDGIQSAYAHIIDGGRLVSNGQTVTAGQLIARTGSTGGSTGCHLHFELRSGGVAFDPVPFMQQRGVRLG